MQDGSLDLLVWEVGIPGKKDVRVLAGRQPADENTADRGCSWDDADRHPGKEVYMR
jgi:hypothetical protein